MMAELSGFAVIGMGGFALGAVVGRKIAMEAAKALHALESRLALLEHRGTSAGASNAEPHAVAMTRLASAIEKHAAAIDDHGAATVAAAVEHSAKAADVLSKVG